MSINLKQHMFLVVLRFFMECGRFSALLPTPYQIQIELIINALYLDVVQLFNHINNIHFIFTFNYYYTDSCKLLYMVRTL